MWLDNYYKTMWVKQAIMHRWLAATGTNSWYAVDMSDNPIRQTNGTYRDYVSMTSSYGGTCWTGTPPSNIASETATSWTNSGYAPNLVVGSGTTPVDPSDYKLEAQITTLSAVAVTKSYSTKDGTFTYNKTMKNTSSETITISEIGLVGMFYYCTSLSTTSANNMPVLGYREVLETPIVVGAGETFTVEITHKISIPG